jgi:hypothetical protein
MQREGRALHDGFVQRDVVIDDGRVSGRGHITVLSLAWACDDPLAVTLHLTGRPDHPALPRGEWAVLRDFLRYGLEEPTGDGSVRIRPDADGRTVLELHRSERVYEVRVPTEVVLDFLDETESVVPTGEEASEDVLDALIERLLES